MLPVLFKVGPVTIYSWGFFLVLAYFVATFILWREGKRQGYNEEKLLDLSIISLVAALVGSRAYFVLLNWQLFSDDPLSALSFWQGGFAYYGALLTVLLAGVFFIRAWKWSFFQIADIGSLSALAALVLGKIGAFLAGLDFGRESALPWAVSMPDLVGSRHPVQLYEAGGYFVIFVLLYLLYFRNLSSANMKSGKVFFAFLILSSFVRGVFEFFRANSEAVLSVPLASLISLIIALISIFALYYFQIRDFSSDRRSVFKAVFGVNRLVFKKFRF